MRARSAARVAGGGGAESCVGRIAAAVARSAELRGARRGRRVAAEPKAESWPRSGGGGAKR
eukprot:scaffold21083_cov65-Phaeocystis_antarctica.AAC.4